MHGGPAPSAEHTEAGSDLPLRPSPRPAQADPAAGPDDRADLLSAARARDHAAPLLRSHPRPAGRANHRANAAGGMPRPSAGRAHGPHADPPRGPWHEGGGARPDPARPGLAPGTL